MVIPAVPVSTSYFYVYVYTHVVTFYEDGILPFFNCL
jgi:hypothetical protein